MQKLIFERTQNNYTFIIRQCNLDNKEWFYVMIYKRTSFAVDDVECVINKNVNTLQKAFIICRDFAVQQNLNTTLLFKKFFY